MTFAMQVGWARCLDILCLCCTWQHHRLSGELYLYTLSTYLSILPSSLPPSSRRQFILHLQLPLPPAPTPLYRTSDQTFSTLLHPLKKKNRTESKYHSQPFPPPQTSLFLIHTSISEATTSHHASDLVHITRRSLKSKTAWVVILRNAMSAKRR